MKELIYFLTPGLNFVRDNLEKIIVILVLVFLFSLAYYLTLISLKKLKANFNSYYPFNRFFPQSGRWSIIYFLIVIIFLGALTYFLAKGGFYLNPA